ncbi:MAG: sigma-70 family RNA polymerase sigma factor [Alicyclobacillaceae bacterium]|nr:sigma-70 family RNA polymerase sigma factor [Alicyclobacillaceae bacterium]
MTQYTPEQEVAWIRTIIRNSAINEQRRYKRWRREVPLLNAPIEDEESLELQDILADESAGDVVGDIEWDMSLTGLDPKEQAVLRGVYWKKETQSELARQFGLSQSRVSQIHQSALQKLKEMLVCDL